MAGTCSTHAGHKFLKMWVGKPEGKIPLERSRRKWRIIMKGSFGRWSWRVWIGFVGLRIRAGSGLL